MMAAWNRSKSVVALVAIIPIFLAFSLSACHAQEKTDVTDPAPAAVDNNDKGGLKDTTNTGNSQERKGTEMTAGISEWNFFYKDRRTPELLEKYKKALKLIVDQKDRHGTMENVSFRLGDWVVIGIDDGKREDPKDIPEDAPSIDHVYTYVVDLKNEKVIGGNDFAALRPLFDSLDLIHRKPLASPEDEQRFLNSLAALIASVATNHWRYIEPISGQHFPPGIGGPRIEIKGDSVVITYFESGSGMTMYFIQNQLTITPTEIKFNSDRFNPEQ